MGSLYVVATPIGNLSDMSARAIEVLKSCRLIAAEDTRHTKRLLHHYSIDTPLISYHKFNERERTKQIIDRIRNEGIDVALVSDAGTPCISDPGAELVRAAREQGIAVYGVPGPSAVATAISVSGLPAREFTFLGFLPRETGAIRDVFRSIKERRLETVVFFESPSRIRKLAAWIREELPQARVCFCCELTKRHEFAFYGPIAEVADRLEEDPDAEYGEYTVVVHVEHPSAAPQEAIAVEAMLVDAMVRRGCSLKEAVGVVAAEKGVRRNEVYRASLRLRSLMAKAEEE